MAPWKTVAPSRTPVPITAASTTYSSPTSPRSARRLESHTYSSSISPPLVVAPSAYLQGAPEGGVDARSGGDGEGHQYRHLGDAVPQLPAGSLDLRGQDPVRHEEARCTESNAPGGRQRYEHAEEAQHRNPQQKAE